MKLIRNVLVPTWILACCATIAVHSAAVADGREPDDLTLHFEVKKVDDKTPTAMVQLQYADSDLARRPVILMLGSLDEKQPPEWSLDLLRDGYMLAAFAVAHEPDPDPEKRPVWLSFDQRFAHSYVLGGSRAPGDAGRVMDYLSTRPDVNAEKFGWMGSSSTGIPGLSVAAREPRLKAIVTFVATGAYEQWLQSWHTNGLWRAESKELWPETIALLKDDPIRHVRGLYPTAVLMVCGGGDKIVDPATTRAFYEAAVPYYEDDPARLRMVTYDGRGHNLPRDIISMYTQHWFRTYLHPTNPPPAPTHKPKSLDESVKETQINSKQHKELVTD